ncbi:membrane-bound lytic murein transglycosylase MltF [Pseudoalteromonas rubra]|uniref:Membrane-bound lytic murein transglycosylase F n=1 Tax=Pseudoalteromonas rubra TaxID=43658 RepID=A0A5S3WN54_9GAMM|nr:membrane-bound lytic murein transglycosylase MltF [Pseudoalteromonas rubra]TMP29626.1 membrane-bound lytic murein transglycosylase MltF [Pseudoalteromonas rubra]TMP35219.1 membrane-bound lytic murein transglycosylase MltF [Pseudoalteromonas rubra]
MRLLSSVLILCCLLLLSSCEKMPATQLQRIKTQEVIRIGTLVGPATFYQGIGGEQGFEYELAEQFADELGVELQMVPFFSLKKLFERLQSGDLDIAAAGLSYHPQRAAHFRFGPSYREISQKLVFKQGNIRPRNFAQLSGPVTVLADSHHVLSLQTAQQQYPELSWQAVDDRDQEELLQGIIDGDVQYTVVDSHSLALFRRYHPNVSIAFSVTQADPVAWVLRHDKDDSLFALLPPFFAKMQHSAQLAALEEKYFGHVKRFNYVNTLAFVEASKTTLPKYQDWFIQYAEQHQLDWRLLAALSYQESMWNPRAKSPTGVRGIMMLTQRTAKQVGVTHRLKPEQNIRGGARYLRKLINRIPKQISAPDRTWFALAAYNVGWGHVNDARKLTERQGADPMSWAEVKKRLPLLTKKRYYRKTKYGYARGDVAVTYVDNIRRYYDALIWLDDNGALQVNKDSEQPTN